MGLQTAKSMGYIDVDWDKIRDDAIKPLDTVRIKFINNKDEKWSFLFTLRHGLLFYALFICRAFI